MVRAYVVWRTLVGRMVRSLSRRGVGGTLALVPRLVVERTRKQLRKLRPSYRRQKLLAVTFDRQMGIDTGGEVALDGLDIAGANRRLGVKYQPTPPGEFSALMGLLDIDHSRFCFIDVGAGKGRTLCLAALYPFERIIGVEFSPELCDAARRNVAQFHHPQRRCRQLEAICLDATLYQLPPVPLVIYLFNPFQEAVLAVFLRNLAISLGRQPRRVFVVYYNAIHRRLFDEHPQFAEVTSGGPPLAEPWAIFANQEAATGS